MSNNRNIKRVLKAFTLAFLLMLVVFLLVFSFDRIITVNAEGKMYTSVNDIPHNKVGLVLGTAKMLKNGRVNLYFKYRVEATVKLFKSGKIDFVLVSGDNGNEHYDEPTDFQLALMAEGIPESRIYLDYAGFRTLDSVVRAKEVFGTTQITFISQAFHNERAIYLAEHFDMKAIAFSAKDVTSKFGLKVRVREYFARTKVFLDFIFGTDPKFLSDPIQIK